MKILRVLSKKVKDKSYFKYTITIPTKIAEESKLLEKRLKATLEKDKIVIEKE